MQILQKKVHTNPKYSNIKGTINTGNTVKDLTPTSKYFGGILGDQLIAKRRAEKFKRIKCSTLAKLICQSNQEESIYQLG